MQGSDRLHALTLEIRLRLRRDDVVDSLRAHFPVRALRFSARATWQSAWHLPPRRRDARCTNDDFHEYRATLAAQGACRRRSSASSSGLRWCGNRGESHVEKGPISPLARYPPRDARQVGSQKAVWPSLPCRVVVARGSLANPRRSRSVNCAGRRWRATNTLREAPFHLFTLSLSRGEKKERRTRDALRTNAAFPSISEKKRACFHSTSLFL